MARSRKNLDEYLFAARVIKILSRHQSYYSFRKGMVIIQLITTKEGLQTSEFF